LENLGMALSETQRVIGAAQASMATFAIVAGTSILGCGGHATTPSPPSSQFIHFTLNSADNRGARHLERSYLPNTPPGILTGGALNHQAADDFTPLVTTAIRTVSWQGGYCGGLPLAGAVPPPTADARAFVVSFYPDQNGTPQLYGGTQLYEVTFTPAEAHERFTFDTGATANVCDNQTPNASYYEYTAVLPTPFSVTAGTRYWLSVRADLPYDMPIAWGWRVGTPDNNYSVFAGLDIRLVTSTADLAFSLSDR
jgi:hypothetical protein